MNTTELIKLLQSVERGASERSREVSFYFGGLFIPSPVISIDSTGDGIAGAELCLKLEEKEKLNTNT